VEGMFHDDAVHFDGTIVAVNQGSSFQERVDRFDEPEFLLEHLLAGQLDHVRGKSRGGRPLATDIIDLDQPDLAGLEAGHLADWRAWKALTLSAGVSLENGLRTRQHNSGCRLHRLGAHLRAAADPED